jgi:SAM-dependent methyltransferase
MTTRSAHAEAQKLFDRIATHYTERSRATIYDLSSLSFARRNEIVSRLLLTTPRGETVLDYGMGPAVFGPAAIQRGLRYIGIDISPKMIELAQALKLPGAEYHLGDLDLLPRFEGKADTVLLIGLIDYLDDPEAGLRLLARCVRPGGRLIMSFRNHRSLPNALRNAARRVWRAARPAPEAGTAFVAPVLENSFVPRRDLQPILASEGFRTMTVKYLDASPIFFSVPVPRPLWHALGAVDAALSRPALSTLCASGVLMASDRC